MTKLGFKVDLDVGDLVSHAGQAKGALISITEAMKKAEAAGDTNSYAKLAYEKNRTQARAAGFDRDISRFANNPKFQGTGASGQPVFKMDSEYAVLIKDQISTMKKLTASYNAAINSGNIDDAMSLSTQLAKQQSEFHKLTDKANGIERTKSDGTGEAIKGIALNQFVSSFKEALNIMVGSIDRTASIRSAGSGDMLGASLAERQRRTDRTTGVLNLIGSGAQGVGMALAPFTGGASLIAAAGVNLITSIAGADAQARQKIYGNRIAYSSLWDDKKDQAMNLAAVLGDPAKVRDSWNFAAEAAQKFGYTAEEAADLTKEAAQQGLSGSTVNRVLRYERATGADRGALSSLANLSARYGGGDALQAAWRGLSASGMRPGQFTEYLRGMERVVQSGIEKGYIRSTDQVARNLTMLSEIGNGSELWKGEQGANRLEKLNNGFASATALSSSSDMLAYRAAKRLNPGKPYYMVQEEMEKGMTPALYRKYMEVLNETFGKDKGAKIEQFKKMGFSQIDSRLLVEGGEKNLSDAAITAMINNRSKALPSTDNISELQASVETMEVRNLIIKAGQGFFDADMPAAIQEARRVYQDTTGDGGVSIGTRRNIDYEKKAIEEQYFGRGGDRGSDLRALGEFRRMTAMAENSGGEQFEALTKAFNTLTHHVNSSDRQDWDRRDLLNTITNSSDAKEFLAKLDRLIELEEKILDVETEPVEITVSKQ